MFIRDYITKNYPTFSLKDEIEEAYETAKEFGFSHVFLQENDVFVGAITTDCLQNHGEGFLGEIQQYAERFALSEDAQILDTVKLFHTFNANVLPVISPQEKYLGYVESADLLAVLAKFPLFSESGATLTVQTPSLHYSLSEISQIVESNSSKLYGCFINSINEENLQITVKMSNENLSSIGETFERFGYIIVQKYYNDHTTELLKNRYDFFQKFLEI